MFFANYFFKKLASRKGGRRVAEMYEIICQTEHGFNWASNRDSIIAIALGVSINSMWILKSIQ